MRKLKTCLEDFRIEGFEKLCRKKSFKTKNYKKNIRSRNYCLNEIF